MQLLIALGRFLELRHQLVEFGRRLCPGRERRVRRERHPQVRPKLRVIAQMLDAEPGHPLRDLDAAYLAEHGIDVDVAELPGQPVG
jgi:hypothetical protein